MTTLSVAESIPEARNYPYNCWWVAAFGHEVGRSLLDSWLLDTPVALYRREDGAVVALEDRCPHRQAPLSIGQLKGDTVECGYHGFCFGTDGSCVRIPSMDGALPPNYSVKGFPVKEIGSLVWIYLGDPSSVDTVAPPPELLWMVDPTFATMSGLLEISANYMLLKENLLDLTNFGYVHASTFEIEDWSNPPQVSSDGETVEYSQRFINSPLASGYARSLGGNQALLGIVKTGAHSCRRRYKKGAWIFKTRRSPRARWCAFVSPMPRPQSIKATCSISG